MKAPLTHALLLSLLATGSAKAITIPSDGSDGALSPTSDIVIDLSLATTGNWDDDNSGNAGNGIYDSEQWAVVFKYTSVNIPADVTVSFINHPTHAPVVMLVSGDVTIDGTLDISGEAGNTDTIEKLVSSEPGPGGFRGSAIGPDGAGDGYGPGGNTGSGEGLYGSVYGNPQIIPLIGGSGGGADGISGGGGGGAILIATPGNIDIDGTIDANGGISPSLYDPDGSGGAIRLIADSVTGIGALTAIAPQSTIGYGRIRIEANSLDTSVQLAPDSVAVPPLEFPIIWPASDAPKVRVASVNGVTAPIDPEAPLQASADINIESNSTVQVALETTDFPISGVVEVRVVKKYGTSSWVTATYSTGDFSQATWIANVTFAPGFTTLQARATVP
ncbi:hypothetical protein [Cerasicoccus maritimus]|uniref:hypothetical protein n=1 Tax=Cerasicoccus maritimus TaxID=490089 RepID=UPI002852AAC8|nr:hypothetical protein [Cerasicoccus maritimus]